MNKLIISTFILVVILFAVNINAQTETLYLVDEKVDPDPACSGDEGFTKVFSFQDAEGTTVYFCLKLETFTEGQLYVTNAFFVLVNDCPEGTERNFFKSTDGEGDDVLTNFCVERDALDTTEQAVQNASLIQGDCPAELRSTSSFAFVALWAVDNVSILI